MAAMDAMEDDMDDAELQRSLAASMVQQHVGHVAVKEEEDLPMHLFYDFFRF